MDNERTNEFEREPEDTMTAAEQETAADETVGQPETAEGFARGLRTLPPKKKRKPHPKPRPQRDRREYPRRKPKKRQKRLTKLSFASPAEREEGQRAATTAPSARSVCARPRYRCSAGWQALPQL